jgi:hypothetical protein
MVASASSNAENFDGILHQMHPCLRHAAAVISNELIDLAFMG